METVQLCNQCGAALAEDAPQGLCPKCLVKAGLMNELSTAPRGTIVVTASQLLSEPTVQPSTAAPEPSQQFGGYRIIRPLGKGGMGAVYEAEEIESGRRVALKVLTHSLDSPEARKRFLREGRLAASVNHPNSVYIYGTEEIDGTPVITMELVSGGTLQARIKNKGPLTIREAVEVTLQIIAGLEAAAAFGVLHRDVKPANCFIETDGTVKVGDFGLSISTLARAETNLTVTGAFLGTPAYASPEQLRGDELDLRSDIYAVGVTLYYLLTGKTPFMADNMVKLLATILEQPAESPAKLRPEIPKELANVVLRCLAKQKEHRFRTYDELRQAISPFDSTTAVPAPLGLRFCAIVVDGIILFAPMILFFATVPVVVYFTANGSPPASSAHLVQRIYRWVPRIFLIGTMLYYAISEGLWGASLGKAVCGLRVVDGNRVAPGLPRALLRTLIFLFIITSIDWLLPYLDPMVDSGQTASFLGIVLVLSANLVPFFVLFWTARRKNGFAGLHELASGTRVVRKKDRQTRSVLSISEQVQPNTQTLVQVGPYHILTTLGKTEGHELLLGYDTRLLRKVWIRKLPPGTPAPDPSRHTLGRSTRLRWLNGKRAADECWDAFEAPSGQPLLQALNPPQAWRMARHWLHDLAEELTAGVHDHSLPPSLALDRIWITNDGRAKLLDFPAPGAEAVSDGRESVTKIDSPPPRIGSHEAQLFLKQAAGSALEGRIISIEEARERPVAAVLPLHARSFLSELPNFSSLEQMVSQLASLLNQGASISFSRRVALILGGSLPALLATLVILVPISFFLQRHLQKDFANNAQSYSGIVPLTRCLERIEILEKSAPTEADKTERRDLEVYVAANFRDMLTNTLVFPETGHVPLAAKTKIKGMRQRMERILAKHPAPSATETAEATERLKPFMARIPAASPLDFTGPKFFLQMLVVVVYGLGLILAAPSLIAALLFRGGLLVHGLGIAFVTRDGSPASRCRLFARSLISWSPLLLFALLFRPGSPLMARALMAAVITLVLLAIGAAWSLAHPGRGLQDRITGVWLVPR